MELRARGRQNTPVKTVVLYENGNYSIVWKRYDCGLCTITEKCDALDLDKEIILFPDEVDMLKGVIDARGKEGSAY